MRSSPQQETDQLRRWQLAIFAVFFVCGLSLASFLSRTPLVRDLTGASESQMSIILLSMGAGSVLGMTFAGRFVDRFGPRRTIRYFGTMLAVGVLAAGFAADGSQLTLLLIGLLVFGLGSGITDVTMNLSGSAIERTLGRARLPLFHALFSVGTLAGAGVGALAEQFHVPLPAHLGTVAALSLALVWGMNGWIDEPSEEPADAPSDATERRSRPAFTEPATLLLGVVVFGMALTEGAAGDWLALTMVDGHGTSNTTGAITLAVFLTAVTGTRVLGVRLIDRFGRVAVIRVSAAIAALGLLLVIVPDDAGIAMAGAAVWGVGAALGFPIGLSAAADDPRRATARLTVVATMGYIGFLSGPPLLGFLASQVGLRNALLAVLGAVLLAGLCAHAARGRSPDRSASSAEPNNQVTRPRDGS